MHKHFLKICIKIIEVLKKMNLNLKDYLDDIAISYNNKSSVCEKKIKII